MARILIVDDESSLHDLVKELLAPEGHELHFAGGGAEAFDLLRKKTVDLVVVDRNMPGMSGIEVVRLIRRNSKTAAVKVLMCTNASVTKDIDEAFSAGADDYLLKAAIFAQLPGKIAKLLALPPRAK